MEITRGGVATRRQGRHTLLTTTRHHVHSGRHTIRHRPRRQPQPQPAAHAHTDAPGRWWRERRDLHRPIEREVGG
jgi:hypothetical protein